MVMSVSNPVKWIVTNLELLDRFFRILGSSALIAAVCFGWFQYHEDVDQRMIQESLNFLERYNKKEMRGAVRMLAELQRELREEEHGRKQADQPSRGPDEITEQILERLNAEGQSSVDTVTDFFDELYWCIVGEVCDRTAGGELFGLESYNLLNVIRPVIEVRVSNGELGYGLGLECIANNFTPRFC